MERNLDDFVKCIYDFVMGRGASQPNLTTLQNKKRIEDLESKFQENKILWRYVFDEYDSHSKYKFFPQEKHIKGVVKIENIKAEGSYPIIAEIGKCQVYFEPRDLHDLSTERISKLDNSEYLNIKIGDTYVIDGVIDECEYSNRLFYIKISGKSTSPAVDSIKLKIADLNKKNERESVQKGFLGGFIGALVGGVLGVIIYLVFTFIAWIFEKHAGCVWAYVIIFAFFIGLIGYTMGYDGERKKIS